MGVKTVKHRKSTASQRIIAWPLGPQSLALVAISDAGGPGSAERGGPRRGWLIGAADAEIRSDRCAATAPADSGRTVGSGRFWFAVWMVACTAVAGLVQEVVGPYVFFYE
ncbi:unnamed protein product [Prorocentrum cordatum]|uniref:Uncharacterized protein n=1 Tax=Prorocentrum cordatum TaxID=2364126 RepID=A0ABN9RSA5_9DINO|nr:unnamed protein product [Polarella glacialis]